MKVFKKFVVEKLNKVFTKAFFKSFSISFLFQAFIISFVIIASLSLSIFTNKTKISIKSKATGRKENFF